MDTPALWNLIFILIVYAISSIFQKKKERIPNDTDLPQMPLPQKRDEPEFDDIDEDELFELLLKKNKKEQAKPIFKQAPTKTAPKAPPQTEHTKEFYSQIENKQLTSSIDKRTLVSSLDTKLASHSERNVNISKKSTHKKKLLNTANILLHYEIMKPPKALRKDDDYTF